MLVDGVIRHESYALTGGPDVPWISMSVAKSFVSALIGIALDEGHISGIDQPISDYVDVQPGSAYDGVSIKDVLQMSSGARWVEDNLTPRDFARIGELYRNGGVWRGEQVVPAAWARESVTVGAPHVAPGRPLIGDQHLDLGYGYQWWIPPGDRGAFSAIGVYNQFVYVDPTSRMTIVKLSANRMYGTSPDEAVNRDMENVALLGALPRHEY